MVNLIIFCSLISELGEIYNIRMKADLKMALLGVQSLLPNHSRSRV